MKQNFILVDLRNHQYVSGIDHRVTSTTDNKNLALVFNETEEWMNGYLLAVKTLTGDQFKLTPIK